MNKKKEQSSKNDLTSKLKNEGFGNNVLVKEVLGGYEVVLKNAKVGIDKIQEICNQYEKTRSFITVQYDKSVPDYEILCKRLNDYFNQYYNLRGICKAQVLNKKVVVTYPDDYYDNFIKNSGICSLSDVEVIYTDEDDNEN